MSFDEVIHNLIQSFQNRKVILFCGAGISLSSKLPSTWDFKESILNKLGVSETERNLIHNATLPFESFVSILQENSNIDELLDIFDKGEPTLQHNFIAELMVAGNVRIVVTTNFDKLIEKALEKKEWKEGADFRVCYREDDFNTIDWENGKPTIIKIHGSIHDRQSMAITMRQVAGTIYSEPRKQIIDHVFRSGDHEYVLITGYSCSDAFDISPYVQMIQDRHKKVVLIEHDLKDSFVEDIHVKLERNPFKKFSNSYRIHYPTETLVKELWNAILKTPEATGQAVGDAELKAKRSPWSSILKMFGITKQGEDHSWMKNINSWRSASVTKAVKQLIPGRIWMDIFAYENAAHYFQRAVYAAREDDDRKREAFSLSLLGNITNSVRDLNQALTIASDIKDKNQQADCLCNLVIAHFNAGQVDKAIQRGQEGLQIAQAIGDKSREARIRGNLGTVYGRMGDFDAAMENFQMGYEISQKIGDIAEEGRELGNIGLVHENKQRLMEARECYKKALELLLPFLGQKHPVTRQVQAWLANL